MLKSADTYCNILLLLILLKTERPNADMFILTIMLACLLSCSVDLLAKANSDIPVSAPVGHLLPLGNHRPPSVKIDEFTVDTAPTPSVFFEKYVNQSRAAIFRGAVKDTTGFKIWTDEYIRENYGELEVRLEGKKEKKSMIPRGEKYLGRDTLRHFINTYHLANSSTYVVSELPEPMFKEVGVLPSLGACGTMTKRFVEIDIWWSGGGSKSIMHKDAYNQINCLYRGTKYWKLFEYKYEKWLHKHWEDEAEVGGYSDINIKAVDMFKHPNITKVPWSNFTINAGDCLFLPKSYYHQVDSDGPNNLAVSILFSRMDRKTAIDTSDCNSDTDYKTPHRLSEFDVMWRWPGKGIMSMGFGDFEEDYREVLLTSTPDGFTLDIMRKFVKDTYIRDYRSFGDMEKAFSALDLNNDGKVTHDELRKVNYTQLAAFAWEVEYYAPSNTYSFEYSFISYNRVYSVLKQIISLRESFKRKQWVQVYMNICKGTKDFANEIFTGLVGSDEIDLVMSKDIDEEVIKRSLKNWLRFWVPQYSSGDNPNDSEEEMEESEVESNDEDVIKELRSQNKEEHLKRDEF